MDIAKDHIRTLLEHDLHQSAEVLGCFLVSSSGQSTENTHLMAEHLILFGDTLFHGKEYLRAIHAYKQALLFQMMNQKQNLISAKGSFPVKSSSSTTINENEVKFKIASCHFALSENNAALVEMETIPYKVRSLEMNLLMARVYQKSRHVRASITSYKECLRQCPLLIEAILALSQLGVPAKDIMTCLSQTSSKGSKAFSECVDLNCWLQRYVEALCCVASFNYKGSLEIFEDILQCFPNNIHILLEMAKVEVISGRNEDAITHFEKVRSLDPYVLSCMDEYAMLLMGKNNSSKLNKLVHDLLTINPASPEAFVALAALMTKKDEKEALCYADKSVRLNERHIPGHIMKGNILLSLKHADDAVFSFRLAHELRPDLRTYQGLVRSYLASSKTKEALVTAREALKCMPQSAVALKLVGDVHANNSSGRDKAVRFYESALRLDPSYVAAVLALADLHVSEGRGREAVSLLEKYLADLANEALHVRLAQVHAGMDSLHDALSHFQAALRINPHNELALKGIERLDKQMKGIDPDATDEEDNEENADVEEEYQDEAYLP